ncbi:MAG: HEPN domain-containing protein [Bryobacterales bacterium]|nr:HEPN domain-containing protein [Bryobacterales bacterium]
MRNRSLPTDYVRRAAVRLRAIDVLYEAGSWADVVRESQEVVELALKGLLRAAGIDPPRIHDVANVLEAERSRLPAALAVDINGLAAVSRTLRRDRELAFHGAEDLTPSDFYRRRDADEAREGARLVVSRVRPHIPA